MGSRASLTPPPSCHPCPTAGAVVGGIAAATLVAVGVWYALKKRRSRVSPVAISNPAYHQGAPQRGSRRRAARAVVAGRAGGPCRRGLDPKAWALAAAACTARTSNNLRMCACASDCAAEPHLPKINPGIRDAQLAEVVEQTGVRQGPPCAPALAAARIAGDVLQAWPGASGAELQLAPPPLLCPLLLQAAPR